MYYTFPDQATVKFMQLFSGSIFKQSLVSGNFA